MSELNEPHFERIEGGGKAFIHPCSICGKPGLFGYGVNLSAALRRKDLPKDQRRKLAGCWYCAKHRPKAKHVKNHAAA